VNAPPELDDLELSLTAGQSIAEAMRARDDDGDVRDLVYAMVDGPDWLELDPLTGILTADTTGHVGQTNAVTRVTDADGLTGDANVSINVAPQRGPGAVPSSPVQITRPTTNPGRVSTVSSGGASVTAGYVSGDFLGGGGGYTEIPVVFESQGGITSMVIEITHRAGVMKLLDVFKGVCMPFGIGLKTEVTDNAMRVTITSRIPLPAGVLDLLRVQAQTGGNPASADLTIRAIEINGVPVEDAPEPPVAADGTPLRVDVGDVEFKKAAQAPLAYDITLEGNGARDPGEVLLDPDSVAGGFLALSIANLRTADSLRMTLAYDSQALLPEAAIAPRSGSAVDMFDRPASGELEITVSDLPALLAEAAVLACVAFKRAPGGRRTGTVKLKSLEIDGADVPLEEELSGWTEQAPGGYTIAAATSTGLSIPMVHAPVRAPEK
ncbi:hypothetical protein AB9K41_18015, partial [Cribrihabitans sp. XS_ASV171]